MDLVRRAAPSVLLKFNFLFFLMLLKGLRSSEKKKKKKTMVGAPSFTLPIFFRLSKP